MSLSAQSDGVCGLDRNPTPLLLTSYSKSQSLGFKGQQGGYTVFRGRPGNPKN